MIAARLYPFWKPARKETLAGLGIAALAVLVELLQPWPMKWLVDYVLGGRPAPAPLSRWLFAFGHHSQAAAGVIVLMIVILALAQKAANLASNLLLIRAGEKLVFELRCQAFDHLHRLSLAYHDRKQVGESLYRVAYDAHAAQSLLSGALVPIFTGTLLFTGILIVMLRLNVIMTLITLSAAPAFLLLIKKFGKRIDAHSTRYHEEETRLVSAAQESLASIRAVQAFTMEARSSVRFRNLARKSFAQHLKLIFTQLHFSAWVGAVMAVGTAAVAYVGAVRVSSGQLQIGDILVFLAYLGMLYQPVNAVCQSTSVVQSAGAQLRRVFEVIDSVPAVKENARAQTLPKVQGHVEYRNISFHYEPGQPILKNINLDVAPGTIVALVGRSGTGKTTLASLLTRFYDPAEGAILLDGIDLRELKLDWLRRQVSVVLQDPILFSGTIRENIAVGQADATDEQILNAARRAQLHQDVLSLPNGYDTVLGERGVNLSGGQRQRLSIARALLKDAPILVLDEPTSALDVHTEQGLVQALQELTKSRTTFIIAHRLSTVRMADFIVVLEDGRIVEQGSHEELLAAGGSYTDMTECHQPRITETSELVLQT
jgi:ATP-binding cassette subfamily B protein/subfamily B ATP-binding cassette protein MsbA